MLMLVTIFLPLVAAGLLLFLDIRATPTRARWTALIATLATFFVSLGLAGEFLRLPSAEGVARAPVQPRMELKHEWLTLERTDAEGNSQPMRLEFYLGVDGISITMIVLTTLLCVCGVLVSWTSITERAAEFFAILMVLETGLIGVFCAFDLVLFYVFFEFTLIPLFFLVGIWGGPLRRYAAGKFFVYTLAGSLITLLGLVSMVWQATLQTGIETPFSLPALSDALRSNPLPAEIQTALFLAIAAGFMVKVPLVPFHTWLPLAHVEAPTAGSVLLAGVLLKLGSYGFLRLLMPMLPTACWEVGVPLIAVMSVVGIIYGSLCALAQDDIKKLVAYSSVAHLGFCMLGLFALNVEGISGGVLQMINHGLSTGALFCLVGMFYERYHTRSLAQLGGLASRLPRLGTAMVLITFASIGLPGLNGFVGEILALMGMFDAQHEFGRVYAALGATGVVLGAWYMLAMLQTAFFGELKEPHHDDHAEPVQDLGFREIVTLAPLATLCVLIGLFPQPLIDIINPDVKALVSVLNNVSHPSTRATQATVEDESQLPAATSTSFGIPANESVAVLHLVNPSPAQPRPANLGIGE